MSCAGCECLGLNPRNHGYQLAVTSASHLRKRVMDASRCATEMRRRLRYEGDGRRRNRAGADSSLPPLYPDFSASNPEIITGRRRTHDIASADQLNAMPERQISAWYGRVD